MIIRIYQLYMSCGVVYLIHLLIPLMLLVIDWMISVHNRYDISMIPRVHAPEVPTEHRFHLKSVKFNDIVNGVHTNN